MNAYERDLLAGFLREVGSARPEAKDPLAESMIREALVRNPDAVYVLVQRGIAAELALQSLRLARRGGVPAPGTQGAGDLSWLRQAAATGLGVSAGVVAGGFLLEGLHGVMPDADASDVMDWF
jgi:hypothetical protein